MDPTQWAAPFPLVVAALFCIVLLRSNGTYWLGRAAAHTARRTRASRWLDSAGYRRAVDRINRWGAPAVSLSFLTVGVQTVINLAAGATRMPLIRYIPATVIGSIAWAFLYGTVGFAGFEALAVLWEHSPAAAIGAGVAAVAALVWFVVRQTRRNALETEEGDEPAPESDGAYESDRA